MAADRIVGHIRMEMRQVRKLERKHKCTINDIALCVVAGALRGYLLACDELPAEDLYTLMPMDIRRVGKDGAIGNHVSVAKVCLYTTLVDSKQRLQAIHGDSSQTKKRTNKSDAHAMLKLVDEIHPAIILWLGQWLIASGRIDAMPQLVNTVVTNVPGLSEAAWLAGAKLVDYLGFGPLAPNVGLFHTVSSTEDHINVSFLSTGEFMGDGSEYRSWLAQSWLELAAHR
ncbi:MAG: WS/DGAT domain-containing protein [Halioglobus sp.]